MTVRLIVTTILLAFASTALAQSVTFDQDVGLPIRIDDQVILHTVSEPPTGGGDVQRVEADSGFTLLRPRVRQEFAHVDDRAAYTFEYRLPASEDAFEYILHVPLEAGAKARVTHGSYRYTKNSSFTVGKSKQEYNFARYLEVDSSHGAFAIDLDPLGAWQNFADFDIAVRTCRVRATDDGVDIVFRRGANAWGGGRIQAKLVIYPRGTPFEQIHPFNRSSYKTPVERQYLLDFGGPDNDFVAGLGAYDAERGYGWVNPSDDLDLVRYGDPTLYHSALVRGHKPATYRLKAEPGWHMLTLVFGDREQSVGALNVRVNGAHRVIGFKLDPNRFTTRRMVVETDDGLIDIEFSGRPWSIDGLVLQPLMTRQEDYLFTRGWWNQKMDWP